MMKIKFQTRKLKGSFFFYSFLLVSFAAVFVPNMASAQTSSVIGYSVSREGSDYGGGYYNTAVSVPIYTIYGTPQDTYFPNCSNSSTNNCGYTPNYITLSTSDTVQLNCYGEDYNGNDVTFNGPKFTGPGTFTASAFANVLYPVPDGYDQYCVTNGGSASFPYYFDADTVTVLTTGPTNLTADATNPGEIDLSWTNNSNTETGYQIWEILSGSNGTSNLLYQEVGPNVTSYEVQKLNPSEKYSFEIRGVFGNGSYSTYSNIASATTLPPPPAPVVSAVYTSPYTVHFSWTDTDDDDVSYYALYSQASADTANSSTLLESNLTSNSYDLTLQHANVPGQTSGDGCFNMVAYVDDDNYSKPSTVVCPVDSTEYFTLSLVSASPIVGTAHFTVNTNLESSDIDHVDFFVNGKKMGTDSSAPWMFSFDSTTGADGIYQAQAVGYFTTSNNGPGGSFSSSLVNFIVQNSSTNNGISVTGVSSPSTNTFNVQGSGFSNSPTNSVRLTPTGPSSMNENLGTSLLASAMSFLNLLLGNSTSADAANASTTSYEIDNLSSSNGSITFSVPANVPAGSYDIQVRSSPTAGWIDTSRTVFVSGSSASVTAFPSSLTIAATPVYGCSQYDLNVGGVNQVETFPSSDPYASLHYSLSSSDLCLYGSYTMASIKIGYECPTGYTLVANSSCESNSPGPVSIGATVASYSCPFGAVTYQNVATVNYTDIVSNICWAGGNALKTANAVYSCPTGYMLSGAICNMNNNPTNLIATTPTPGQINLSWNNNGVKNIANMYVERAAATSAVFTRVAVLPPASTTYADTGLLPSQIYKYRVNMLLSYAATTSPGPYTAVVTVTTLPKPNTPTLTIGSVTSNSLILSLSDNSAGIAFYSFFASSSQITLLATTTNKTYSISNLQPDTKYCYLAIATVSSVYISATSTAVCATTVSDAPTAVMAQANVKGSVLLKWTDNAIASESAVVVERAVSGSSTFTQIASLPSKTTTYTDAGLPPSTGYQYRIRSQYQGGSYGSYSIVVSVTTLGKVATPAMTVTTVSSTAVNIKWQDSDSALITGYTLMQTSPINVSLLSNIATTTYLARNLTPATNYCYAVSAAINPVNISATTTAVCAKTSAASVGTVPAEVNTTTVQATSTPVVVSPTSSQITTQITTTTVTAKAIKANTISTASFTKTASTSPSVPPTAVVSASPIITYSCASGEEINGQICTFTATSTQGTNPTFTYTCPSQYTLVSKVNLCSETDGKNEQIIKATALEACPSNSVFNSSSNKCYTVMVTSKAATPVYSCPAGYAINSAKNECVPSITVNTVLLDTADVLNAAKQWLVKVF